jgi:hypothetical protein
MFRTAIAIVLLLGVTVSAALAQNAGRGGGVPMRPPLFFSETWKPLSTPPDDHNAWPVSAQGVSTSSLELVLLGTTAKEIQLVAAGRGGSNTVPMNLWTGTTTTPSAAALRDRNNFVNLSAPLAKIRWVVRTSGFHQAWPLVKLADGTWLVGDRPSGLQADFNESEITPTDLRWLKLDPDRVVTVGTWIEKPDLSKVDAVGFADLMPGSGHGAGGYINVGKIEVYGAPVKR